LQLLRRQRLVEQVALRLLALQQTQQLALLLRLHALRDDLEPEAVPQGDDRRRDRHPVGGVRHGGNERSVDLEGIDRQPRQVAQRGIAGAEIVDRDAYPHLLDGAQLPDVALDVLHEEALGDLQVEAVRLARMRGDLAPQHIYEIRLCELDRRYVYGDGR